MASNRIHSVMVGAAVIAIARPLATSTSAVVETVTRYATAKAAGRLTGNFSVTGRSVPPCAIMKGY